MQRVIYLPAVERHVTLGQYVRAIQIAKENPAQQFKYGLTCWWPCSGAEIVEQFRQGMMDRINRRGRGEIFQHAVHQVERVAL